MTAQVDPKAKGISGFLSKMTFGTLAGKRDPVARLFGIDHDSIVKRLEAKDRMMNPDYSDYYGKQEGPRKVKAMEAHRDTLRSRSTGFGKDDETGVAGAAIKLGRKT